MEIDILSDPKLTRPARFDGAWLGSASSPSPSRPGRHATRNSDRPAVPWRNLAPRRDRRQPAPDSAQRGTSLARCSNMNLRAPAAILLRGCLVFSVLAAAVGCGNGSTASNPTGIFTMVATDCSCDTGGITAVCTGTTTFTAASWTASATELLAGCQTSADAGVVPSYTCVYGVCGQPCGDVAICASAAAPDAAAAGSSSATATATSTGT